MSNKTIYLAIGLMAGTAVTAWYLTPAETQLPRGTVSDSPTQSLESRLIEMESAIADQLDSVRGEIETLRNDLALLSETSAERPLPQPEVVNISPSGFGAISAELERVRVRAASQSGRIELLTEAGFSFARAEEIERLVEESRVAAMQARYEAARSGDSPPLGNTEFDELFDADSMLRSALGDADFERYLAAMGRPTEVTVMSVLSSSAAQQAGMLAGDRIIGYDGHRVFDARELVELPLDGEPGAPVIVDIVRDGQAMQLVLPRGPLGILGSAGPLIQFAPADDG